jgi:hypothetical protein
MRPVASGRIPIHPHSVLGPTKTVDIRIRPKRMRTALSILPMLDFIDPSLSKIFPEILTPIAAIHAKDRTRTLLHPSFLIYSETAEGQYDKDHASRASLLSFSVKKGTMKASPTSWSLKKKRVIPVRP